MKSLFFALTVLLASSCALVVAQVHSQNKVAVVNDTGVSISPEIVDALISRALEIAGEDPHTALLATIYFKRGLIEMDGPNGSKVYADGVTNTGSTYMAVSLFTKCLPASALMHEVVHLVVDDTNHEQKELWDRLKKEEELLKKMCTARDLEIDAEARRLPDR